MDGVSMHGSTGPRWSEAVIRVAASDGDETWMYQFPTGMWRDAVRRIMADASGGVVPDVAAGGLIEMIAEGVADGD